ncbi:PTS glucose transporter subunit IIA [Actinomyces sp. B33]|uniref:PTS sugar transporter subunit IIA n=1 Tax=Actinomyces sp. B33 TaxID=2942131 RepID=UPI002340062D|nr:PTS glucose transporter subunit IIA [Actinomyces sp. B33]MDC4232912.1 PTS glucose transporter subunit IIA [Actinomyces sp. B33]
MSLQVASPVAGEAVALANVPDPVFAQEIVGTGLAVQPAVSARIRVVSPFSGTVVALHPHAFVVRADSGQAVLVHVGIDTVELGGRGFEVLVGKGDRVESGEPVIFWDPSAAAETGLSTVVPVIVLEPAGASVSPSVGPGTPVVAGAPLLRID